MMLIWGIVTVVLIIAADAAHFILAAKPKYEFEDVSKYMQ